jgi:hypothetical protein
VVVSKYSLSNAALRIDYAFTSSIFASDIYCTVHNTPYTF